jgi:hypothetical protein
MTAYLDAGFLLTLLIRTPGSLLAQNILGRLDAPFQLNFLHQLQAENLLARTQLSGDSIEEATGLEGQRLWRYHLAEGVFQVGPADWDTSLALAVKWNRQFTEAPPVPLLILHPALAAVAGATHFMSFDPRSRSLAKAAGLKLLPDRL